MTIDEIKRLRASEYGVAALRPDHVDWLIAEVDRLRIANAVQIARQFNFSEVPPAEAKAADDVRLGNRLYVWDYDNPEDGSWDNIEEYLHDTTPNAGETVRLNLALPLQDVEVEMLEVGKSGEPIRWVVRDAKTGTMLAPRRRGTGREPLPFAHRWNQNL